MANGKERIICQNGSDTGEDTVYLSAKIVHASPTRQRSDPAPIVRCCPCASVSSGSDLANHLAAMLRYPRRKEPIDPHAFLAADIGNDRDAVLAKNFDSAALHIGVWIVHPNNHCLNA